MNTYTFLITSLIIILIPGTGVIYTISTGISKGRKASLFASLGCTTGIVPHLCISILLSSFLVKMSPNLFLFMKIIGAIYLLYLGLRMLFSKNGLEFGKVLTDGKPTTIIRRGILINLLNPKLTLFFFSFLPQYVSSESQYFVIECLLYGCIFMILTFVIFIGYGMLAGTAKTLLNSPKLMNLVQKLFGIIFIGFAIQLGLSPL
ncbi:MAG: putative threonine efflux protein [Lachnospiraceae bacterium]|jgi:threonine/homoserine/homoserine lactone efflux protein|nr:putative threonine efflux protein [Lachnospiraceae bacterium]